jgi:hypothetical protein
MKIADSRVKKCKDITIIIDKKMRQRKIEMERFIIPLMITIHFKSMILLK